jgi:hypothetical protein
VPPSDSYVDPRINPPLTPTTGYRLRLVVGWATPADLPPLLTQAVGLLTAHFATTGRDLATVGTIITSTINGYAEAIGPFQIVTLA